MMNPSPNKIEKKLLGLAAVFLLLNALILSLSPAGQARSWDVRYRWEHWLGWLLWLGIFALLHGQLSRRLPDRDPYLLPIAALLSGWGLLVIWRLSPDFGLRQSVWLLVSGVVLALGLRLPADLSFLRRYKYVWLTCGLLLTAATLIFGTNPMGPGPRLWLGCCGLYLQPSEPLKQLLVIYLAAYLADRQGRLALQQRLTPDSPAAQLLSRMVALVPLLAPTLIMTGLALLLLIVQRDLGTASIFLFLYGVIVYAATREVMILLVGALVIVLAGLAGYVLFDVVRLRVDAWLNPWLDPSGRSYQIVQSLLAVANGGLLGRGPGLGYPYLVPVAQSDFIFAAIAEEYGLAGALGLLLLIGLLLSRGLRAAIYAGDYYRRYLATGLIAHLTAQSVLIIGGNLRLLPLTGVTLPFVSYGGSSLLVSFLALLFLLRLSEPSGSRPVIALFPYRQIGNVLLLGLAAAGLAVGWWAFWRGPELLTRTDNPRRALSDLLVRRGSILDRNNLPLAWTTGQPGSFARTYISLPLGPVIGYTHPVYGQSGLEASLDDYLRGLQGNPDLLLWWHHLLYGQPPTGLDVRLSLDLKLQRLAADLLQPYRGAIVLMNARTGEILLMASSPGFDANTLDQTWPDLIADAQSPLLNRAALGLYPVGSALGPLLLSAVPGLINPFEPAVRTGYSLDGQPWLCALDFNVGRASWGAVIAAGCPGACAEIGSIIGGQNLLSLYTDLGLYTPPPSHLPAVASSRPQAYSEAGRAALGLPDPQTGEVLLISPLQAARAAAVLSSNGILPVPRLATAVNTPRSGWVILPSLDEPKQIFVPEAVQATASALAETSPLPANALPIWQSVAVVENPQNAYTWYLAGTLPSWQGAPLSIAVLLETNSPVQALAIGQAVLTAVIAP